MKGKFIKTKQRTVNTISSQKNLVLNGINFTLVIWDTAGEEKYHALAPIFYHGADGAIIVYDCTRKETFERAGKWYKELKELAESNPRIILVANKIDLPDKEISSEEGNQLAKEYNSNFFEISALTGVGVDNIFENITNEIYNYKMELRKETEEEEKNINDVNPNKKKLVISFGNERYEKRNNESGSCAC